MPRLKPSMLADQRGQVLAWTAILLPVLMVFVGLVFDGGLMWVQYRHARWAADGSAVAAAQEINLTLYRRSGEVKINPSAATTTLQKYSQANDPDLHLTSITIQNNVIEARGWVQIRPVFLSLFGVGSFRLNVTGHARPAYGVQQSGQ